RLPEVGGAATSVFQFSPDGKFLPANYADGHCRVWDWAKSAVAVEVGAATSLDFAADGKTVGIWDSTNIVLRNLLTGKHLGTILLHGLGGTFRLDPLGQRLASWATEEDTNVVIADIRSNQAPVTLRHPDRIWSVAWDPSGKYLATAGGGKIIQIWDSITGERLHRWQTESCISMGFSHSGEILAS